MNRPRPLITGVSLFVATCCAPGFSQGVEQMIYVPAVKPQSFASGYRTSKLVGRDVFNELGIKIGTVDDLIVTREDKVPFAVLAVGGFLGIDSKLVIVPFSLIEIQNDRMMFRGATKDSLEKLPAFNYET